MLNVTKIVSGKEEVYTEATLVSLQVVSLQFKGVSLKSVENGPWAIVPNAKAATRHTAAEVLLTTNIK